MKTFMLFVFVLCISVYLPGFGNAAFAQAPADNPCSNIFAGSIIFTDGSARIAPGMQKSLAVLAGQMQYSPACKLVVMGNAGGSKVAQQLSWDRVNATIEYMSETHNIDRNRFVFNYESAEPPVNNVTFRYARTGEEGPSNVAAPHPDMARNRR